MLSIYAMASAVFSGNAAQPWQHAIAWQLMKKNFQH